RVAITTSTKVNMGCLHKVICWKVKNGVSLEGIGEKARGRMWLIG
ncbi:hypothetical protein GEW_13201, partial [Pasteurella multocida subsp. gallicida str. Anand1_poultry]